MFTVYLISLDSSLTNQAIPKNFDTRSKVHLVVIHLLNVPYIYPFDLSSSISPLEFAIR